MVRLLDPDYFFRAWFQPITSTVRLYHREMRKFSNAIATVDERASSEELYLIHYAHVLRLCRLLLTDPHEAEETAQEVFLKAVREHQARTDIRSWRSWL